ncbi:MAG: hypothetical protein ACOY4W_00800 [Thermodesulfobacteriota bacterium]
METVLAQFNVSEDMRTELSKRLLWFFDPNRRSANKINDFLQAYVRLEWAAGHPKQLGWPVREEKTALADGTGGDRHRPGNRESV